MSKENAEKIIKIWVEKGFIRLTSSSLPVQQSPQPDYDSEN